MDVLPNAGPFGPPLTGHPLYSGQQLLIAAREQELLYRELLSRPPYCNDPILAQQVRTVGFIYNNYGCVLCIGFS